MAKITCDQCELMTINIMGSSLTTHESGCPNQNKTWDKERQEWVSYHDCRDCGYPVEDGKICNCNLTDDIGEYDESDY